MENNKEGNSNLYLPVLANKVANLCREVGQWMLNERKNFNLEKVEFKGVNDLVSYVDKQAEATIITNLQNYLPDAGFVSEEGTISSSDGLTHPGSGKYWIIDPLDGTTNFIHGLPIFAVSVALMVDNVLQIGCVYEPNKDECFLAWKGGGSYLNNTQIHVKSNTTIEGSLLATGFPYSQFKHMDGYLATIGEMMQRSHGLRRMGSAAVDLAYTACGRFDGFFEYYLKAWDCAAGILLVQEAGGQVTDFSGKENYLFGGEIIAAGGCHTQMQDVISRQWR